MAKVFDNAQVAHVWASQSPTATEGRSHNGNFHFNGRVISSYRTPVASFAKDLDSAYAGPRVVLVTSETFSVTTSGKHMGPIRRALHGLDVAIFHVPSVGFNASHELNFAFLLNEAATLLKAGRDNRFGDGWKGAPLKFYSETGGRFDDRETVSAFPADATPIFIRDAMAAHATALDYAEAFGLDTSRTIVPSWPATVDDALKAFTVRYDAYHAPKAVAKRAKDAAKREAIAEAKAEAEAVAHSARLDADYQAWVDGGPIPSSWSYTGIRRDTLAAAERAEQAERQRLSDLDDAAKRAAWLAGSPVRFYSSDYAEGPLLRVRGTTLETSQGASVPLSHAVRVFKAVKACRDDAAPVGEVAWRRNGSSIRVGHFQVDTIYRNGDFKAGCHLIRWNEVSRIAQAVGVFGDDASLSEALTY